jgi:hypothetical protein
MTDSFVTSKQELRWPARALAVPGKGLLRKLMERNTIGGAGRHPRGQVGCVLHCIMAMEMAKCPIPADTNVRITPGPASPFPAASASPGLIRPQLQESLPEQRGALSKPAEHGAILARRKKLSRGVPPLTTVAAGFWTRLTRWHPLGHVDPRPRAFGPWRQACRNPRVAAGSPNLGTNSELISPFSQHQSSPIR